MAEARDTLTLSDDDISEGESLENFPNGELPPFRGALSKWTNYIHGWQDRFFVLKDGTLSYFKSEEELSFGCRGAVSLLKAAVTPHDFDECRFDVTVGDCLWYLRAKDEDERQKWMDYLEVHRQSESGYGSDHNLRRHGSLLSITSVSTASSSSFKRGRGLKEKLAEMETFKEILCKQVDTLQGYFDTCAHTYTGHDDVSSLDKSAEPPSEPDSVGRQHAAHSIDFKGESFTFKATTAGIIATLSHCVELMQQREDSWQKRFDKEVERRKRLQEHVRQLKQQQPSPRPIAGPDMEEGPHCALNEDQFFDAVDSALDSMEKEAERQRKIRSNSSDVQKPSVALQPHHRLYEEINQLVSEHVRWARVEASGEKQGWQLIAEDGEMRVYKREVEQEGVVLDPLKATHTVKGITGHELCHYFWSMDVRLEWETAVESSQVVEYVAEDTVVCYQMMKRVWPTAQRDSLFWSHLRHVTAETDEGPDYWIVVNKSCDHPDSPAVGKCVRADLNVAMLTQTVITPPKAGKKITRDDISCKIMYCATVNPGGWAPPSVLRTVYKREYPKFIRRFTQYVVDKTKHKPILF